MNKSKKNNSWGQALRNILRERGLSDRRFTIMANLTEGYLSHLANDGGVPRTNKKEQIAKGLDITVEELEGQINRRINSDIIETSSSYVKVDTNFEEDDFYIEPSVIKSCYSAIEKPGCLLRIQAPRQMGKTELMLKIINYADKNNYRTVAINLALAEKEDLKDLESFLRWFCTTVTARLGLSYSVDEHWKNSMGNNKIKCMTYFEDYLLSHNQPLALFLDDLEKIFIHENITGNFFSLLRNWYHESKITSSIWRNLRQILVYVEPYTKIKITESPFNVGKEVNLSNLELSKEHIKALGEKYEISLSISQIDQLFSMIGGHPYLAKETFTNMKSKNITIEEILEKASTNEGVYNRYLQQHWQYLQQDSQLIKSFKQVVLENSPVKLEAEHKKKLNILGLVKFQDDVVISRYELYRYYFRKLYDLGDS